MAPNDIIRCKHSLLPKPATWKALFIWDSTWCTLKSNQALEEIISPNCKYLNNRPEFCTSNKSHLFLLWMFTRDRELAINNCKQFQREENFHINVILGKFSHTCRCITRTGLLDNSSGVNKDYSQMTRMLRGKGSTSVETPVDHKLTQTDKTSSNCFIGRSRSWLRITFSILRLCAAWITQPHYIINIELIKIK